MKKRKNFTRDARIMGTEPSSQQLEAAGWARLVARHGEYFQYGIRRTSGYGYGEHRVRGTLVKGADVSVNTRPINHYLGGVERMDFAVSFTRDRGFRVGA